MALTTSEEIQKQLTVIFGFHGQLDLEVGEILGIGKLSKEHSRLLVSRTLAFLDAYNAMLRDYTNTELYSIEFDLHPVHKDISLKLMPKSMLFIPGEYKECTTLLLLLSQEMSLLDNRKARAAVDLLGKRFFEVEDALKRPELTDIDQKEILSNFANRFAYLLESQAIEGKWNRKLVGLKTESDELGSEYLSVRAKYYIQWGKYKELSVSNYRFTSNAKAPTEERKMYNFQYNILSPAVDVVIKNTFRLTQSLLEIANNGTIDDLHHQIMVITLQNFANYVETMGYVSGIDKNKHYILQYLPIVEGYLSNFRNKFDQFCSSGESGTLTDLLSKFDSMFKDDLSLEDDFHHKFSIFTHPLLENTKYQSPEKVRCSEFQPSAIYFEETGKLILKTMEKTIPRFFQQYAYKEYAQKLVSLIYNDFDKQRKPVRALGLKFLSKFCNLLNDRIAFETLFNLSFSSKNKSIIRAKKNNSSLNSSDFESSKTVSDVLGPDPSKWNEAKFYESFKLLSLDLLDNFMDKINVSITDLMGFVEIMLANIPETIPHIEKLKEFESEINYLWGITLRSSTLQQFLKPINNEGYSDLGMSSSSAINRDFNNPDEFGMKFYEFLRKRLGGTNLYWAHYVFKWIEDFRSEYQYKFLQDAEKKKYWSKTDIVEYFIKYINTRKEEETSIRGFLKTLKSYVEKYAMNIENRMVMEIYKSYEMSLDLIDQIPDFIDQTYRKAISELSQTLDSKPTEAYIGALPQFNDLLKGLQQMSLLNSKSFLHNPPSLMDLNQFKSLFVPDTLYHFILEHGLKYFSPLYCRPVRLYLKNIDNQPFDGESLYHIIEFRYWDKFMKISLKNNLQNIIPKF